MTDNVPLSQSMRHLPPLTYIFQLIARHWLPLLVVGTIVSVIVLAGLTQLKISYLSTATVVFDPRDSVVNSESRYPEFVHMSGDFAEYMNDYRFFSEAVDRMQLAERFEFNYEKSFLKTKLAEILPSELVPSSWLLEGKEYEEYVRGSFLKRAIKGIPDAGSYRTVLTAEAENPQEAFEFTKTVMDLFIERQLKEYLSKLNFLHAAYEAHLEEETLRRDDLSDVIALYQKGAGKKLKFSAAQKKKLKDRERNKITAITKMQEELSRIFDSEVSRKLILESELANMATRMGPTHPEVVQKNQEIIKINQSNKTVVLRRRIDAALRDLLSLQARMKQGEIPIDTRLQENTLSSDVSNFLISLTSRVKNLQLEKDSIIQQLNNPDQRIRIKYAIPPRMDTGIGNKKKLIATVAVGFILIILSLVAVIIVLELRSDTIRDVWRVRNLMLGSPAVLLSKKHLKYSSDFTTADIVRLKGNLQESNYQPLDSETDQFQKMREVCLMAQPLNQNPVLIMPIGFNEKGRNIPASISNIIASASGESSILLDLNPVNSSVESKVKRNDVIDFLVGRCKWGEVKTHKNQNMLFDYAQVHEGDLRDLRLGSLKKLFRALNEQYYNVVVHGQPDRFFLENYNISQVVQQYIVVVSLGVSYYSDLRRSLAAIPKEKVKGILILDS